ncbi:hypothetical protein TWF106_010078 [Orbilia oligospora]|uniref:Uncharacterized protein n=1 Tax=Orbilia oligospora TaxID=2813651 RepID=A0A6G1MN83_ORBOL|nr:hypothetical protein TWF106_010078 [Orbilia oligospora]KAF3223699.1 hypothetical protein TWF679_000136 [Orbilia oligospora]KAF3230911.1 hypothetical protein TWF191_008753 [Orbilia oligospora]KAF3265355.1 hypothetical protein TWF192_000005 [Orbilia oligospora]
MAMRNPNRPRPVSLRANGSYTFGVMIEWTFMRDPIEQSVTKIYRITPGHYLYSATNQFEADQDVAALLTDPTKKLVYKDINGVAMDPKKTFDENGLIPPGPPGQGVKTIEAELVDIDSGAGTSTQ